MATELLKLDLTNIQAKIEKFTKMAERAEDLTPVWEFGHHLFGHEMAQQFMTQGRFSLGVEWAPLNPEYEKRKLKKWGPLPSPFGILYRSGELFESLTNEGHPEHVNFIMPGGAVYGSTVFYGAFHQVGGGRLPQRKIINVRARFRRMMLRAAQIYIVSGRELLDVRSEEESDGG